MKSKGEAPIYAETIPEEEGEKKYYLGLFGEFEIPSTESKPDFSRPGEIGLYFERGGEWIRHQTERILESENIREVMDGTVVGELEEVPEEWLPIMDKEAERRMLKNYDLESLLQDEFSPNSAMELLEELNSGNVPSPDDYEGAVGVIKDSNYMDPSVSRIIAYTDRPERVYSEFESEILD